MSFPQILEIRYGVTEPHFEVKIENLGAKLNVHEDLIKLEPDAEEEFFKSVTTDTISSKQDCDLEGVSKKIRVKEENIQINDAVEPYGCNNNLSNDEVNLGQAHGSTNIECDSDVKNETAENEEWHTVNSATPEINKTIFNTNDENIMQKHFATNEMQNIKSKKYFKCYTCNHACTTKYNMVRHMKMHSAEKLFKCDDCQYRYICQSELDLHNRREHKAQFKCESCGKRVLGTHVVHGKEKPLKCDVCEHMSKKNNLITDYSGKSLKCYNCPFSCSVRRTFVRHMRTHREKKCNVCEFKCNHKSVLLKHMKTLTEEKDDVCEFRSSLKRNFIKHIKSHRVRKCDICEFTCSYKRMMIMHVRSHGEEKSDEKSDCKNKCAPKSVVLVKKTTPSEETCDDCGCIYVRENLSYRKIDCPEEPSKCDDCMQKMLVNNMRMRWKSLF